VGCHNPQTWDFDSGKPFTRTTLNEILTFLDKPYVSRLTISGGHPFEPKNAPSILKIVECVKKEYPQKSIWIYTGYTWEEIKKPLLKEIMKYTDVLVDGRYVDELRDISLAFRGSSNQKIIDVQQSLKEGRTVLWRG
jgi:anaerobic ribonucleoside-triphosphate reductase activating protein